MLRRSSSRIIAVTFILVALAAITVNANWGSGFGFSIFSTNNAASAPENAAGPAAPMMEALAQPPAAAMTTPLNAVTTFDAAVLVRYVAGIGPIPSPAPTEKLAAADTTGNCAVTSPDAANIIGWVTDNIAGATTNTTINPPGPCANFPITVPVLKGDVTGTAPVTTLGSGSATVSLPAITPSPGLIVIPVMVTDLTGLDVLTYDMQIDFDPSLMTPASPPVSGAGTVTGSASAAWNTANAGHLIVSVSAGAPLTGSGTLINLRFDVFGLAGQSSSLSFADYTSNGPGSHTHQGFLFNEGLPASITLNGSVTMYQPSPSGTPTDTPTSTATATYTPTPLPGAPQITSVQRTYSGFFLERFNANNVFDVHINWQGSPGTVRFQINNNAPFDVPGNAMGVMQAFNMSTAFTPSRSPSVLKITPTNGESVTGVPWTGTVYVFPFPSWLQNAFQLNPGVISIFAENAQMKAKLDWKFPQVPIDSMKVTIPQWVPYIGGEFGVRQTQAVIKGSVSSLGTGDLSVGGQTGFKAMESEVNGRILGTGNFLLNQNGLRLTAASLSFTLNGTLAKEIGIVEAVPSLAGLSRFSVIKQFNEIAKLRGEIAPEVTVSGNWMQSPTPPGELGFDSITGTGMLGLKGILKVKFNDHLTVQGWLGGGGSVTFGLPEPYLRQVVLTAEAGVELKVDFYITTGFKYARTFKCVAVAGGGGPVCGEAFFPRPAKVPLSKIKLRLLRHHYGQFGKYEQFGSEINRNLSTRVAQATEKPHAIDPPFLANVFPGAQPKLIPVGSTGRMLLYVRQDPMLPVLQSTDIAWSYFDGTTWSSPGIIVSDTRAEMAPVAGVDENGKVVAAWLRIKDPAFSGTISTLDDLPNFYKDLEVVSAVFDPALGTWSAVTQLTDDLALDTSLRLSSDSAGKLLLTWQSNPSGEFSADAANPATLKYIFWNGSAWNSVATVATGLVNINEHASAVYGNNAFIVVPQDPDLNVTGDRVLLVYVWDGATWSSSTVFAAGGVDNLNPSAAYDAGGQGHVIWLRGSDIVHATLASPPPQLVRPGGDSMAFYDLQFINNAAGNMTLVRQEASDTGPAKIFAAIYDTVSQTWSDDLQLNDDGDDSQASASSGYYGADGKLRLAYLATQINRITETVTIDGQPVDIPNIPQDGQTDLRLLEYTLATDLAVADDDLSLSTTSPEADDATTADLIIHNSAAYPVNNFNVKLYAGDPMTGTLLDTVRVTDPMPGGSDRDVSFAFNYPASALVFTAVVDSENEVAESSEINNIAVMTLTAPSPTPTPPPASLTGVVVYGNAASPPKFISNVTVTGLGSPTVTTTTDAPGDYGGQYVLTGFGSGSYTVSLSKTTGQNGITSNDAARIAQHVAGTLLLTGDNQRVSADVTGNAVVSSNDAAKIAQFVAGLPFSPPNLTGTWQFYLPPGPTFPIGASPTSRTYASITNNVVGDDYVGLLIGETTGNWTNTGARPVTGPERSIAVDLPRLVKPSDKEIIVPVTVQSAAGKGIISYEFDLRYDPSVIQPLAESVDFKGTASRGLSVVTNANEPGLLRVVVYGALPIDGDGVLLNLRFTAVGKAGSVSPLMFERIMFNEGEPRVSISDGRIEISSETP